MKIIFPTVDLKSTKLSEVPIGSLFVEDIKNINNEGEYKIKLGFPEKDSKVFCMIVVNDKQPTIYQKDADRFVYIIDDDIKTELSKSTCFLNSVKQQIIFIFEDDNEGIIYLKTDKSNDTDTGLPKWLCST